MVHRALENVELIVDYSENMHRYSEAIGPGTGLLYPGPGAVDIRELAVEERPRQLMLLDGTWNQVKRLYRYWPKLAELPHYKISPEKPGEYRIRLEPNEYSLSTVEATVAALKFLEPETAGLDRLLSAFHTMIERQLAHPRAKYSLSSTPRKPTLNVPKSILSGERDLVVVYGEAEPITKGAPKQKHRAPVYWVAHRFGTDDTFESSIESRNPVTQQLLDYFELPPENFEHPATVDQFQSNWKSFLQADDLLVVYNKSTLRLLDSICTSTNAAVEMRSINFDPEKKYRSLTELFDSNDISVEPTRLPGRAGKRLANLATLIKFLREQVK